MTPEELDRLEIIARNAGEMSWEAASGPDAYVHRDYSLVGKNFVAVGAYDGGMDEEDAQHVAAFDPPTALQLVAAARVGLVSAARIAALESESAQYREAAEKAEKECERLRGGPPGPYENCTVCDRPMVWSHADTVGPTWVCPRCTLVRARNAEAALAAARAENEALRNNLREQLDAVTAAMLDRTDERDTARSALAAARAENERIQSELDDALFAIGEVPRTDAVTVQTVALPFGESAEMPFRARPDDGRVELVRELIDQLKAESDSSYCAGLQHSMSHCAGAEAKMADGSFTMTDLAHHERSNRLDERHRALSEVVGKLHAVLTAADGAERGGR